jgi:malate dehydrogenase (oxaloacetate-decarboxylating)(NADP+)
MVAVISNGTAVLGLGNLGALAAKPVMEGKAVLFKRFADIDAIDLEIDTEDVDAFINCVRYLGPSFGGINLEDIKAPECFIIEQRLREIMDIPVFHDDQHGTAIITAAGFLNALDLTGRKLKTARVVVNGAGSAAIACIELIKALGLPHNNAVLCDSKGVIYQGREEGINQWKSAHAVDREYRVLTALQNADICAMGMWGIAGTLRFHKRIPRLEGRDLQPALLLHLLRKVSPGAECAIVGPQGTEQGSPGFPK